MKKVLTLAMITMAFAAQAQTASDEAAIKKKVTEYLTPRSEGRDINLTIFFGDLNEDKVVDAAVNYCIATTEEDIELLGGGTMFKYYTCYQRGAIALLKIGNEFIIKADKDIFKLDEEGWDYSVTGLQKGKIISTGIGAAETDMDCCPSQIRSFYVIYSNNRFIMPNQTIKIETKEEEPVMEEPGN